MPALPRYEVLVIGGGPAGLSAALIFGRCRRKVLVCDDGRPRNAATRAVHGFLTRDGIAPADLRLISREQLARYQTVELCDLPVIDVVPVDGGFEVALEGGELVECRKLVLATGLEDELPPVPGAEELYGSRVFHCPYCDGYEVRDMPLIAYGRGDAKGADLAIELTVWSRNVVLCTNGPSDLGPSKRRLLAELHIPVHEQAVLRLAVDGDGLRAELAGVAPLRARALFFNTRAFQRSRFAASLGCEFDQKGCIRSGGDGKTGHPGLYVVGDASRGMRQVVAAAAEGAAAAVTINQALLAEDLQGAPAKP